MLKIKLFCENCAKELPPNSSLAMICSFECTFCKDCVDNILMNVCPNCGGGFEKRPIRPKNLLSKYPASEEKIINPLNKNNFEQKLNTYKNTIPEDR